MSGEAILIVDDNPANMKLVSFLLTKHGFDVRCAASAAEALESLHVFRPRLILMDLQMPVMDGFEFTRQLKAAPATRDIVIVAISAYAMQGDELKALDAGCNGYLTKPIDTRSLIGFLTAQLAHGKPRS